MTIIAIILLLEVNAGLNSTEAMANHTYLSSTKVTPQQDTESSVTLVIIVISALSTLIICILLSILIFRKFRNRPSTGQNMDAIIDEETCLKEESESSEESDVEEETMKEARQTRKHQGDHECEVSFGGEGDLHQQLILCGKNPGHTDFVPVKEFKLEHLPLPYQDSVFLEWIQAWAERTCRVAVKGTSQNRPEFYPDTDIPFPFSKLGGSKMLRTGSGWMSHVYFYSDSEVIMCRCEKCTLPNTNGPKKAKGEIHIYTVAHVVFDSFEATKTECQFFYDDPETDLNAVLKLNGLFVYSRSTVMDFCRLKYITHDLDLLNKFEGMRKLCVTLGSKVYQKYNSRNETPISALEETDPAYNLAVCISHPHGCSKQITIGSWTQREVDNRSGGKLYRGGDKEYEWENTWYKYNTPTCRGSSGARIFSPVRRIAKGGGWTGLFHPHSEGRPGNDNNSAVKAENV